MSVSPKDRTLASAPPWFQVRTIRLEFGPCRSGRLVLDALGDVLARTGATDDLAEQTTHAPRSGIRGPFRASRGLLPRWARR